MSSHVCILSQASGFMMRLYTKYLPLNSTPTSLLSGSDFASTSFDSISVSCDVEHQD